MMFWDFGSYVGRCLKQNNSLVNSNSKKRQAVFVRTRKKTATEPEQKVCFLVCYIIGCVKIRTITSYAQLADVSVGDHLVICWTEMGLFM